jgi:carboxyl-terminal processing protease
MRIIIRTLSIAPRGASRRLCLAVAFAGAAAVSACQESTAPPPPEISLEARVHLEEMIDSMQAHALHRLTIDWRGFREDVFAAASGAQAIPATYSAILRALVLLQDRGHSRYISSGGGTISVPYEATGRRCVASFASRPALPPGIAYVRVGSFSGPETVAFAESIQDTIRAADQEGLVGWIVDLRGNGGGNMWPMLAGLGPILGEGTAGYFVSPTGDRLSWGYSDGMSVNHDRPVVRVGEPYLLRVPMPRVAVLFDGRTASSGEAIVLAFRGRPDSRSFGAQTCGLATAVAGWRLSNGAILALTVAWMADRHGTTFPLEIDPDEVLPEGQEVARAIEWLTSEQE